MCTRWVVAGGRAGEAEREAALAGVVWPEGCPDGSREAACLPASVLPLACKIYTMSLSHMNSTRCFQGMHGKRVERLSLRPDLKD